MTDTPSLFADALQGATIQNNVVRLQLVEIGGDGNPIPCGQLKVPLNAFPALVANLTTLLQQMEERLREAQQPAGQSATPAAN